MTSFTLNGVKVEAKEGENILDVAQRVGTYIPSVSYDPRVKVPFDELALVQIEGERSPVAAYTVIPKEGMVVETKTEEIVAKQQQLVEKMFAGHYGDCYPPCQLACPCQVPCGDFIRLAGEGKYAEALKAVRSRNPWALVCGTVCPRFCENQCRRQVVDEPVAINDIKRYLAEINLHRDQPWHEEIPESTGKKVAIVGAGPAGLGAAHFLRIKGHEVTVFEKMDKAGGMLRYGIPAYRLPREDLDSEVKNIAADLGVKFEYGKALGKDFTVDDLKAQGFDGCIVAVGAQKSLPLPIGGSNNPNVLWGVDFLRDVAEDKKTNLGKRVICVGGGNVSFDVVRSCVRLGCDDVTLTCILKKEDMPALDQEIEEAEEEGIKIRNLEQPVRVITEEGSDKLKGIEYLRRPACADIFDFTMTLPGTEHVYDCDTVIVAIGQMMDIENVKDMGLPVNPRRVVDGDHDTGRIARDDGWLLYACGDCLTSPATVVEAVCTSRHSAWNLDALLRGVEPPMDPFDNYNYHHSRGTLEMLSASGAKSKPKRPPHFDNEPRSFRSAMPTQAVEPRVENWKQVIGCPDEKTMLREANRCMQCGCGVAEKCKLRKLGDEFNMGKEEQPKADGINPFNVSNVKDVNFNVPVKPLELEKKNPFIHRDLDKCIDCRSCVAVCRDIRRIGAIEDVPGMPWKAEDMSDRTGINVDPTVCESCATCLDNCPTNALYTKQKERNPDTEVATTCPYCGCGCGMIVGTRSGHVCSVRGEDNNPASHGQLCVKGRFGLDYVDDKERLTVPLIRRGGKGGKLEPATWDEALDLVATKLTEIRDKHGPRAVAGFSSAKVTNEENYIFMKFMRAVMKTNNVDHCARLCHASTVAGLAQTFGSGAMTNSIDELEFANVILVTGSNTTETHPIVALKIKKAVREHGAKVIIVDPRKITLTHYAAYHLPQRSGTDVMIFNSMIQVIIKAGLHEEEFIKEHTENYDAFLEEVMKPEYDPKNAAVVCGVPEQDIIQAALLYGNAERGSIVFSMGITQHSTGTDNVLTLANLSMVTRNIGRYATGVNPLRGQNNVQGACDLGALPNVYSGYQKVTLPAVKEKFEKAWGVTGLDDKIGHTVTTAINAAYDGDVKAIYCMGENPAVSDPNLHHAREALARLDFLVCQDIFETPTTKYADVVLPASSFLEKDGTFTNTERRVCRVRQVVDKVGETKEDWDIVCDLARRCGYDMPKYKNGFDIMEEIRELTPSYGGMHYDRLDVKGLQWPCLNLDHPGTMYLHKDGKFARGKGAFKVVPFKEPAELPDKEYPLVLTTGRLLYQFHTGTMSRRTAGLNEIAPTTHVEINAIDAEKLGVKDGEKVKVASRRGEVIATALVPSRVKPGVIFMPFHFEEQPANMCTNDVLDPVARIPELKACSAKIVKIDEEVDTL